MSHLPFTRAFTEAGPHANFPIIRTEVGFDQRHTKDVIKMVPVVPLFSTEHSKGKILALSQELSWENKCNG